jgi:hypothetical protein
MIAAGQIQSIPIGAFGFAVFLLGNVPELAANCNRCQSIPDRNSGFFGVRFARVEFVWFI